MVRDFHDAFGYKQDLEAVTPRIMSARTSFLLEEGAEIMSAVASSDRVGELDGAVDLAYFALGTLAIVGQDVMDLEEGDQVPHLIDVLAMTTMHMSGLPEKPMQEKVPDMLMSLSLLYHACKEFTKLYINADLDGAFEEVQRSNMSKLDENGKAIYNKAGKIMKSNLFSEPVLEPFLLEEDHD